MIILDISMPKLRGLEAISEARRICPAVKVLILTMHKSTEYVYHAVAAGADSYLLKDDTDRELLTAIEQVRKGGSISLPTCRRSSRPTSFVPAGAAANHRPNRQPPVSGRC